MAAKTCVMFLKPCLLPSEAPGTLSHRREPSSEPGARERSRETCLICSARLLVIGGKMATHAERENNDFRSTVGQPRHASEHKPAFFARWFMSRSEEHTSELQSLMRISYAVFCLKKKSKRKKTQEAT